MVHIECSVQVKEWRNVVFQSIVSPSLVTGVRTMSKWSQFLMGSGNAVCLQM